MVDMRGASFLARRQKVTALCSLAVRLHGAKVSMTWKPCRISLPCQRVKSVPSISALPDTARTTCYAPWTMAGLHVACEQNTRAVVYTAIPVHYLRSAGLIDRGPKSPRYNYDADSDGVEFSGPLFQDMVEFVEFRTARESALIKEIWNLLATPAALITNAAMDPADEGGDVLR